MTELLDELSKLGRAACAGADALLAATEADKPSAETMALFQSRITDWKLATEIAQETGITRREQRACAEFSDGAVIGGKRGYKLTASATIDELDRFEARMLSQIAGMRRRVVATRKARNSLNVKTSTNP